MYQPHRRNVQIYVAHGVTAIAVLFTEPTVCVPAPIKPELETQIALDALVPWVQGDPLRHTASAVDDENPG